MYLSRPDFSFVIPSVHDNCQLECRLYLPRHFKNIESESLPAGPIQAAIIAHPYASLGGCYDDPVVGFIGGELQNAGYIVGTFNFRGAGGSDGRTSWTAKPELKDYTSFYGFMLHYLHSLLRGQGCSAERDRRIELIIGGYSYGSMIASHVPSLDVMIHRFPLQPGPTTSPDTPIERIRREARKIAAACVPGSAGGGGGGADGPDEGDFRAALSISYLLVSPVLPPVSSFLTMFTSLQVDVGDSAQARAVGPADQLSGHRTLALFGDEDTFTSVRKLRQWSAELGRMAHSQFRGCEIEGAGHFWREEGVEGEVREVLRGWL